MIDPFRFRSPALLEFRTPSGVRLQMKGKTDFGQRLLPSGGGLTRVYARTGMEGGVVTTTCAPSSSQIKCWGWCDREPDKGYIRRMREAFRMLRQGQYLPSRPSLHHPNKKPITLGHQPATSNGNKEPPTLPRQKQSKNAPKSSKLAKPKALCPKLDPFDPFGLACGPGRGPAQPVPRRPPGAPRAPVP